MMTQVAHLKTPKKLVVIDLIDERLELAREYGADVTINPARDDAREIVRSLTDGYGCDVYIETTGAPVGVSQADLIRKLGRFVEFSVFGEDATVDWSIIGDRKGSTYEARTWGHTATRSRSTCSRALVTSKGIVTHDFALEDWDDAIRVAKSPESIKVLLKPAR